jgi:CRISPR-associated Csx14 family protein
MGVMIATLGLTPSVVTEMMDELQKRNINIEEVHVVTTKGSELSYHVLKLHFLHTKRYPQVVKIKQTEVELQDINSVRDVKTYRNRFHTTINSLKYSDPGQIYVNIAGGRKTMPIDAYLLALSHGIENIYHVVAPGIGGVENVNQKFTGDRASTIRDASENGTELSKELLEEIDKYLHPNVEISLIKVPVPRLSPDQREELRKALLD